MLSRLQSIAFVTARRLQHWWRRRTGVLHAPLSDGPCGRLQCDTADIGAFVWHELMPRVGISPFPPHELMLIAAAMVALRPRLVVEWGTNIGVSARVFHEINRRYNIQAAIHSIDLPDATGHVEHPRRWRGLMVRGLPVTLHQGDGRQVAARLLVEERCTSPLVFIDGDHAMDCVLEDARAILRVAPQASLLFHDTFSQPGSSCNHGPADAVRVIACEMGTDTEVVEAGLGHPGMTLLARRRR